MKKTSQGFFVAVILYESSSNTPNYEKLYEESFILLKAESLKEAEEKAEVVAQLEQSQYQNEFGETITWSMKQIIDVNWIGGSEPTDGATIYSRHFRNFMAYQQFEPYLGGKLE